MNKRIYSIFSIIIILSVWEILTVAKIINPLFLPTPQAVFLKTIDLVRDGKFIYDLLFTLYRVFFALALAMVIGIPIGLLMGYSDKIYYLLRFPVDFFRSVPATAFFPLFILMFGVGDLAKILIGVWSSSLIIIIHTMHGTRIGKELRLKAAKVLHIRGFNLFSKIIFPEALPHIYIGIRVTLSLVLVVIVVTEMFVGTNIGLGKRIFEAATLFNIPELYSAIITLGILGFTFNKILVYYEKKFFHWFGK